MTCRNAAAYRPPAASRRFTTQESRFGPAARARGGLADQVVALGDVRGPVGGFGVGRRGGGQVAAEFEQVPAHGVPAVPLADHLAQPVGLTQPGGGTEDMADRDRAAEHRGRVLAHRILGQRDEVVVPGEDLRPVGLPGAGRVVVQGGDRGLDLIAARAPFRALHRERRLQDAHALGDLAGVPPAAVLVVEP
jgi:hypothetical protein